MNETTDAATILAPLWKRKWLILLVGLVVAGACYEYYKRQPSLYQATTQLDLGVGSEAQQLVSGGGGKSTLTSRSLPDAASLITPGVGAEGVQARLKAEHVHASVRGKVHAKSAAGSDFVAITPEARTGKAAARLANAYALVYIARQHTNYQRQVRAAISNERKQLRRIEASQSAASTPTAVPGKGGTTKGGSKPGGSAVIQAANLASKINQLESDLGVATVQQVSPAKPKAATLLEPTPKKNAIFGFVLGVLLAAIAAFLIGRLERRLRSISQIEALFESPVLAALPAVKNPVVHRDGQVRPAEPLVEPLRRLNTALQMVDVHERGGNGSPRVILFISADAGDGRSSLVADLALTQRDAGVSVAVIEADLRRPVQGKLLDVSSPEGLAEVLVGASSFDTAVQRVQFAAPAAVEQRDGGDGGLSTVVQSGGPGSLSVLTAGGHAANPPALLASPAMQGLLRSAASGHDYVLIDAPPPLQVSDVMPLLQAVDAIVIVARIEHTREASASRLVQLLARTATAPVLGVVANAATRSDMKKYGFSAVSAGRRRRNPILR